MNNTEVNGEQSFITKPPPIVVPPVLSTAAQVTIEPGTDHRPTNRGFRLHWLTAALAATLACWVVAFPLFVYEEGVAEIVGQRTGAMLGSLACSSVIALLAWIIAGRSRWAANATLCILFSLYLTGTILVDLKRARSYRNQKVQARLSKFNEQAIEDLKQQIASGQVLFDRTKYQERLAEFEDIAHSADAENSHAGIAVAKFLRDIEPQAMAYNDALKKLIDSGSVAPATLTSAPVIEDRIRIFEAFRKANQEFETAFKQMPIQIGQTLKARGVSPREINQYIAIIQRDSKYTVQLGLRRLDAQVAEPAINMLEILLEQWGKWSFDRDLNQIAFDDPSQIERYNAQNERLQRAAEEQTRLMQQLTDQATPPPNP